MFDQSIIWLLSISSQIASLKLSSLNSSVNSKQTQVQYNIY